MTTWDDIERIAFALPDVEESTQRGDRAWKVRGKAFVWARPLRTRDLEELGAAAPAGDIACVWVADELIKDLLVTNEGPAVFTTGHFDGYNAVLIALDLVETDLIEDLITDSWRAKAPKRLAAEFDRGD